MTKNHTTQQTDTIHTIHTTQLANVTGGGAIGALVKGAKKLGPIVADKAVEAAKWTGIPAAIGGGAAWVKHKLDK